MEMDSSPQKLKTYILVFMVPQYFFALLKGEAVERRGRIRLSVFEMALVAAPLTTALSSLANSR